MKDENLNVYPLPEMVHIPIYEWQEEDIVIVIKDAAAWKSLDPKKLSWDIGVELDATAATEESFTKLLKRSDGMGEIVYAVGGGLAADAAKYVAAELDMPLVVVPTALSADVFWTWASATQENGVVHTLESVPPEILLLDLSLIQRAPVQIRAAGIADVLSIATACLDWQLAYQKNKLTPTEKYDPATVNVANAILQNALACAEPAGRGEADGLRALANALAMTVQLSNLAFHSRAQEGSEHFFAYCAEAIETKSGAAPHTHAEYVGAGILAMAQRQGLNTAPLQQALQAAGVPLKNFPSALTEQTLRELPNYVRKQQLPYGWAWEL